MQSGPTFSQFLFVAISIDPPFVSKQNTFKMAPKANNDIPDYRPPEVDNNTLVEDAGQVHIGKHRTAHKALPLPRLFFRWIDAIIAYSADAV